MNRTTALVLTGLAIAGGVGFYVYRRTTPARSAFSSADGIAQGTGGGTGFDRPGGDAGAPAGGSIRASTRPRTTAPSAPRANGDIASPASLGIDRAGLDLAARGQLASFQRKLGGTVTVPEPPSPIDPNAGEGIFITAGRR